MCSVLDLYADDGLFRATIDMSHHGYGQGEYRYFKQPYPEPIEALKQGLYPRLLPIAQDWWTKLGREAPWPDTLDDEVSIEVAVQGVPVAWPVLESANSCSSNSGHGYIFITRERPVRSTRGWSAAPMRLGVSTVGSGHRYTLGLVFHDAA